MRTEHKRTLPSLRSKGSHHVRKLKALSKAVISFSSSLDLDPTLSRIAQESSRITEYQHSIVLLLDEKGERLTVSAVSSPSVRRRSSDIADTTILLGVDELSYLVAMKKPALIEASKLPESLRSLLIRLESALARAIVAPLVIDNTLLGFLLVTDRGLSDNVNEVELDIIKMLTSHAAAAIRNAQSVRAVNIRMFETVARGKREWEQTFDAISDGIFISNADHVVIRANKAFAAIFGKHPRDIVGKKCHEIIWQTDQVCDECPHMSIPFEQLQQPTAISVERLIRGMESLITAYPIMDYEDKLSAIVHVVKDTTEQKKMQELVIRSEKLRAVGEMASGIAHDFNNLLASIIGWSEVMLLSDMPPHLKECANAIHQAAVDGTETVKRIQEYTRIRKDTQFASIDINEVVRGAIELARPRWKGSAERAGITINISTVLDDVPPVQGNASDLREVFLNIIFNAIDAMPEGGEIVIRSGRREDKVYVAISDTGIGMTEDVQRRVFDPFFTTKASTGNGLGLSVAYGIIARHNGELTVESSPGKGSTFTTLLPISFDTNTIQYQQVPRLSRKARILLIDDDRRVLQATEAMLRSEGHAVTKCLGGKEGISAFAEQAYDLVITDLGMPEMNGWEVAAKVKTLSASTPVVILTGWGAEIPSESLSELGIDAVIQKPCQLATLRQTINQVLKLDYSDSITSSPSVDSVESRRGLHILVIEDNRWFGEALKERLELDRHFVSIAASGQDGIRILEKQEFELVLSDLKLPDISGIEVARIVRQLQKNALVALMTGDVAALDSSLLQESSIDAVLHKPWKEHELQHVLDKAFERFVT